MYLFDQGQISRIKPSFVTRRVDHREIAGLNRSASDLKPGDLVVARVEEIGHHTRIERPDGRKATLFPGDEVLLACGARYAPDQFEADCPASVGPAHLAAAGGIAGVVRNSHTRMKPATTITILGAAHDSDGVRLNLDAYRVSTAVQPVRVPVIAVCGTSMNAGKTYTVGSIVRGLTRSGLKTAAIKVTGTGAGGDLWMFRDCGAAHVRDFTDAGFASTYRVSVDDIFTGLRHLITEAETAGADVVVLELADGLQQSETSSLLLRDSFQSMLTSVVFAAGDAMGAQAGLAWLRRAGLPARAVSGCLTQSPLAMRELDMSVDLPCLTAEALACPDVASRLMPATGQRALQAA